ncbi:hypothetical protein [Kribbella sp. NPDC055071]
MELGAAEIRAQNEMRLAHFRAYSALPTKIVELAELYRTAAPTESEDETVQRIAKLFDTSPEVAFAIHNCQLLYLHPQKQAAVREEIESLEEYLRRP